MQGFTPSTIEQRVRIAVNLLHALNAGRAVTRAQLAEHLADLPRAQLDEALGCLRAAGAIYEERAGIVPRAPPFPVRP